MLKIRIIPCLDVKDGRVVKGVNFVDLRDAGDPVEQAMLYDAAGADELCFLDITASHEKRPILLDVVRQVSEQIYHALRKNSGTCQPARNLLAYFFTVPGSQPAVEAPGARTKISTRRFCRRASSDLSATRGW